MACSNGQDSPERVLRVAFPEGFAPADEESFEARFLAQFERVTNCRVEWQAARGDDVLTLALARDERCPDVIIVPQRDIPTWVENDLVLDLAPHLQSWNSRSFVEGVKRLSSFDGRPYFLPFAAYTFVLCVNRKALDYLPDGVDIENLSWEQTARWSVAVRRGEGEGKFAVTGVPQKSLLYFLGCAILSYGGAFPDMVSPGAVAAWEMLIGMREALAPAFMTYDNVIDPMRDEEAWMALVQSGSAARLFFARPGAFLAVPPPRGPRGMGAVVDADGMGIYKHSRHHSLAARFIQHIMRPETQAYLAQAVPGYMPAVRPALTLLDESLLAEPIRSSARVFDTGILAGAPAGDGSLLKGVFEGVFWSLIVDQGRLDRWFLLMGQDAIDRMGG